MSTVTQITLKIGAVEITNKVSTEWPIKWTSLGVRGEIQIRVGDYFSKLNFYDTENMYIILFDSDHPNGLVWGYVKVKIIKGI
ncbi:MAG: hypothetical protein AB1847_22700 [bacterium]